MAEVTVLLRRWKEGDEQALTELTPIVYAELRRLARSMIAKEGQSTLQGTALVHEVYMRLAGGSHHPDLQDRAHFFSVAARVMRRVLVDRARKRQASKRGGADSVHVPMENADFEMDTSALGGALGGGHDLDWAALDEALDQLAKMDPRRAKVVEMRFFGGFSDKEIADLLDVSEPTIRRDWVVARTWLFRRMTTA
jgi:RNA polymerase sigma factor (TIGR02999 family)